MEYFVLMKVTNRARNIMLYHSPLSSWNQIPNGRIAQRVQIVLGRSIYRLRRVDGYHHQGGINNCDVDRWLRMHYGTELPNTLLFNVTWNQNDNSITYTLVGKVVRV